MKTNSYTLVILLLAIAVPLGAAPPVSSPKPDASPRPFEEEVRFIETLRDVRFPELVKHETIHRDELKEYLRTTWKRDLPLEENEYFDVLRALHLIDEGEADPLETLLDLYVEQVLAFYDPIDDVFYSIAEPVESELGLMTAAFERSVTVHELVHALQDQLFDAGTLLTERLEDWDGSLAYQALIEGEATLVMLAALAEEFGGSLDDRVAEDTLLTALGNAATVDLAGGDTPAYFVESLKFPYVDGLAYAIDLYRKGGWSELARAHESPPTSTEQIYDGEKPDPVLPLGIEGSVIETTFGEFHWRFLLGAEVADEWEGDRIAVVRGSAGLDVLALTRWASEEGAERFASAYRERLEKEGSAPLIHRSGLEVAVGYGPDRDLVAAFVERRLNPPEESEENPASR